MNEKAPERIHGNAAEALELSCLVAQLSEMAGLYGKACERITQLEEQIRQLHRRLFGASSERYVPNQILLDELLKQGESQAPAAPEPVVEVKATQRRKASPHGRTEIPDHLEREDILLDIPEEQKIDADGNPMIKLREEISEKLAWRAGCWYVKRFIRPVYVSSNRQSDMGVVCAPMPDSPIDKCKADNSVLSLVAVQKWDDHLPTYRQRGIFQRQGIHIPASTLDGWAIESILKCDLLADAIKTKVLSSPVIHTDDSPVDLQVPGRGKTKEARLWVYLSGIGPPLRFFDFTTDRCKERPGRILEHYKGFVQADAYSGYDHLFAKREDIVEVGCWAHARRKFDEAKTSAPAQSCEMLGHIRLLYDIERRISEDKPEVRLAVRQTEAIPLLDSFFRRVTEMLASSLPSQPLGKALTYAIRQKDALMRYTTDGRLCIDNNPAENAIRPLAIGRKNWLFAGSERGGKACAIAMSLIHSAKALGINCQEYLTDVFSRIMSHPVNRLHELLPDEWKAAREKQG